MDIYVGTSGWLYDWNPNNSLDWYLKHSGLNAVELNASFYRIPYPSQVRSWVLKGRDLRWSVKVNRYITHYYKLSDKALEIWDRFVEIFKPMDDLIDFYLLQLPPSFRATKENIARLSNYIRSIDLGWRLAVEFRHESWFNEATIDLCRDLEVTLVSIDSPIATWINSSGDTIYLRLHGRSMWYLYDYSAEELKHIALMVIERAPSRIYVFFNNNHYMLGNARVMKKLLEDLERSIDTHGSEINS
ncbi:MAG: DUF72 domain-containing protein [Sulfolobales archaeon]